jgi:hypothetical protein
MLTHFVVAAVLGGSTVIGPARMLFDSSPSGASLRGVHAVYVSVRCNAPQEQHYGLTESDLQREVTLMLGANGIRTLTRREWKRTAGSPYLFVNVVGNTLDARPEDTTLFYTVTLELVQRVALDRSPRLRCDGITWSEGTTAVLPGNRLRTVAEQLGTLVSDFSLAVQEANSGKPRR